MTLLVIDTAANLCTAAHYDPASAAMLAMASRDIGRGHAEEIMHIIDAVFLDSGGREVVPDKIAVSVGPGSFTGIRVGVATARALALAWDVKAGGVTTLQAIACDHVRSGNAAGSFMVTIHGGRGSVFAQTFDAIGNSVDAPFAAPVDGFSIPHGILTLVGNASGDLAEQRSGVRTSLESAATGSALGFALAAEKTDLAPTPLYLRGADAKPQENFALPRKRPDNAA